MRFVLIFFASAFVVLISVLSFTYATELSFLSHEVIGFSKLIRETHQSESKISYVEWCRTDKDRALRYGFLTVFYYDIDVGGLVYIDGLEIYKRYVIPYWEWTDIVPYLDYDNLLALFHELISHAPRCPEMSSN